MMTNRAFIISIQIELTQKVKDQAKQIKILEEKIAKQDKELKEIRKDLKKLL